MWVQSLGREDALEKEMATHSSILVWRIPWTQGLGRLQSTELQRVKHDWVSERTAYNYEVPPSSRYRDGKTEACRQDDLPKTTPAGGSEAFQRKKCCSSCLNIPWGEATIQRTIGLSS